MQSKTNAGAGKSLEDSTLFFETFPFFIWLLRDVTQDLPPDCKDIKEYFLKKVYFILIVLTFYLGIIFSSCAS